MTQIVDNGILSPPEGITPELWARAHNVRYWASFHCCPLPPGNLVIFSGKWEIVYLGPVLGALEYLQTAAPPDFRPPAPPTLIDNTELLKLLNLE